MQNKMPAATAPIVYIEQLQFSDIRRISIISFSLGLKFFVIVSFSFSVEFLRNLYFRVAFSVILLYHTLCIIKRTMINIFKYFFVFRVIFLNFRKNPTLKSSFLE